MKANSVCGTGWSGAVVLGVGGFSMAAQTLLFRRFLAAFEGNELGVAWFFASWLAWVGAGAWLARGAVGRQGRTWWGQRFDLLSLLYLAAYLLQVFLLDHARDVSGVRSYELFPLVRMLPAAFLANAPVGLCTGFLFPLACAWAVRSSAAPVVRVYILESAGGFLGAVGVTLLLAGGMAEERVTLLAMLALATLVGLYRLSLRDWLGGVAIPLLVAFPLAAGFDRAWGERVNHRAWDRILPASAYRGTFSTPQAVYRYGEYEGQFNVLAWQSVADSVPNEASASESIAALVAQNPAARRFLVAGPGAYAICRRLQALPQAEAIVWMDPDPGYPSGLLRVLPARFAAASSRLRIPSTDIRGHLRHTADSYDLVILNLPPVTTLAMNRYLTREFFELVRARLAPDGVVGVRVPGGENVMGDELVHAGASVYHTLGALFAHLALKPGDDTWIMASDGSRLSEAPAVLRDRWNTVPGGAAVYPPDGLLSLYLPDRIAFQQSGYQAAVATAPGGALLNTDRHPRALLYGLLLAARETGGGREWAPRIRRYAASGMPIVPAAIILLGLMRLTYRVRQRQARGAEDAMAAGRVFDDLVLVLTTGAVAMSAGLALMLLYQAAFGSLFLHGGLLSAVFMLGLCAGSLLAGGAAIRSRTASMRLAVTGLAVQAAVLLAVAGWLPVDVSRVTLALLCAVNGLLSGLYVPAAAASLKGAGVGDRRAGALIEVVDHAGGSVGSLLAGLVLVPVFGVGYALAVMAALLVVNVLPFLAAALSPARLAAGPDRLSAMVRPAGYALFGLAAFLMASSLALRRPGAGDLQTAFGDAALGMSGGAALAVQRIDRPGGAAIEYFTEADPEGGPRAYLFSTERLAPDVSGYGGPVVLAVRADRDGVLQDLRLIRSRETPAYVDALGGWLRSLVGRNLFADDGLAGVDAVSGATVSSVAIRTALEQSGRAFARDALGRGAGSGGTTPRSRAPDGRVLALCGLAAAALLARRSPGRLVRGALTALCVVGAGFVLNVQYSLAHVMALIGGELPPVGVSAAFVLVIGVPALVLLAGNVYCGHLCPFGLLQEAVGSLRFARARRPPDHDAWRHARLVKYVLLFALVVLFALTREMRLASADPLVVVFSPGRSMSLAGLAVLLLTLSYFLPRFWCRAVCPTGAFLSLLNGARLLSRLRPRVVPARCEFGVASERELDCLCCDRCRWPASGRRAGEEESGRGGRATAITLGAVAVAGLVLALAVSRLAPAADPFRARGAAGTGMRQVDLPRLRMMIRQGALSDHEALHYRHLPPDLPSGSGRPIP